MIQKTEKVRRYIAFVFLLLMFLLLMGCVTWFSNSMRNVVTKITYSFLQQTANHQASTFHTKLDDQLKMLESVVLEFQDVDFNNYNQLKRTILSTSGIGEFKEILVSDANGIALCNNNTMAGNLSQKDYFKSAMSGNLAVSEGLNVDDEGEDVLALSVPIYQKEQICGVLTGTFNREVLNELFNMETFDGTGYNYIIDTNGNIIVDGGASKLLESGNNYLAFLQSIETEGEYKDFVKSLKKGDSGIMSYVVGTEETLAAYQPIGIYDWYVISVVPKSVIYAQNQSIMSIVVVLILILTICFVTMLLLIIHYKKKIRKIESTSNRKTNVFFNVADEEKMEGRDTLTGMLNRTTFHHKAAELIKKRETYSTCCLLMLEINSLTQINKQFGYTCGDNVLKYTARQLDRIFYPDDLTGRMNGDIFGVCMFLKPSYPYEKALLLAKKKAKKLCAALQISYGEAEEKYDVSAYIGIAIGNAKTASYEHLMKNASQALETAKQNSDSIEIYTGEMI